MGGVQGRILWIVQVIIVQAIQENGQRLKWRGYQIATQGRVEALDHLGGALEISLKELGAKSLGELRRQSDVVLVGLLLLGSNRDGGRGEEANVVR